MLFPASFSSRSNKVTEKLEETERKKKKKKGNCSLLTAFCGHFRFLFASIIRM